MVELYKFEVNYPLRDCKVFLTYFRPKFLRLKFPVFVLNKEPSRAANLIIWYGNYVCSKQDPLSRQRETGSERVAMAAIPMCEYLVNMSAVTPLTLNLTHTLTNSIHVSWFTTNTRYSTNTSPTVCRYIGRVSVHIRQMLANVKPRGTGVLPETLSRVCGPLPKTLTLFMTKICDYSYPIYDPTKNLIPYLWP